MLVTRIEIDRITFIQDNFVTIHDDHQGTFQDKIKFLSGDVN